VHKKYNRTKFIIGGIIFYVYQDLSDLLRSYFRGLNSDDVKGYDGKREEVYKYTAENLFALLVEEGYWGFVKGEKSVHLWIDKGKKSFKDVLIYLVAHEIGHTIKPFYKRASDEEIKATRYEEFVELAYRVTEKIMLV